MDYDQLAAELLRSLRGRRSLAAFSRQLGYRSNIASRWEAQLAFPTAATFLRIMAKLKPRQASPLHRFFARVPPALSELPRDPAQAVGLFLNELRGKVTVLNIAESTGINRYSVSRWLSGRAQPRLPQFLQMVEVVSRRLLDFVACCCDPSELRSVAGAWKRLELARDSAYKMPWSHAVLRALELESSQKGMQRARLLERLGIGTEELDAALRVLAETGQIVKLRGKWQPRQVINVNTAHDRVRAHALKVRWTETALSRMRAGAPGNFGYSVFSVSKRDLKRLREIHLEYVRAMQRVLAQTRPAECVGLYCAQLLDFGAVDNALDDVS